MYPNMYITVSIFILEIPYNGIVGRGERRLGGVGF